MKVVPTPQDPQPTERHRRARRVAAGQERPTEPSPAHPTPHPAKSPRTPSEADRWPHR